MGPSGPEFMEKKLGCYALAARLGQSIHRYSMTVAKPAHPVGHKAGVIAISSSSHP